MKKLRGSPKRAAITTNPLYNPVNKGGTRIMKRKLFAIVMSAIMVITGVGSAAGMSAYATDTTEAEKATVTEETSEAVKTTEAEQKQEVNDTDNPDMTEVNIKVSGEAR